MSTLMLKITISVISLVQISMMVQQIFHFLHDIEIGEIYQLVKMKDGIAKIIEDTLQMTLLSM